MKKLDKKTCAKLAAFDHSRERELMPRPTVFRDRTKYSRKSDKAGVRREIRAYA